MIVVSIKPKKFYVNQATQITLSFLNDSNSIYTNIRFSFRLSHEILIIGGKSRLPNISHIEKGLHFDYQLKLKATKEGIFYLNSTNFSYLDSFGQSVRPAQIEIPIKIIPLVKQKKEMKTMVDPINLAWITPILNKSVELLFNQLGNILSDRRAKIKKSSKSNIERNESDSNQSSKKIKFKINEQIASLKEQSSITHYQLKLRELESLIKQIDDLNRNKILFDEEAVKLPSIDERVIIRRRIEDTENVIVRKANQLREILEELSQEKINIPIIDD